MLRSLTRLRSIIVLTMAFVLLLPAATGVAEKAGTSQSSDLVEDAPVAAAAEPQVAVADETGDPYFLDKLTEWKQKGASDVHDGKVVLHATDYSRAIEGASVQTGNVDGRALAIDWRLENEEWIEYDFFVEQAGLYKIDLTYRPVTDDNRRRPILLNVSVDGRNEFLEARSVTLDRRWKDPFPASLDSNGDQIRPMAEDISGWMTTSLRDSGGAYVDPLQWYLTPGKHTLRFTSTEPFALGSIELSAPDQVPDYETARQPNAGGNEGSEGGVPIVIEAEQADWKSDSSISLRYDNEIDNTPYKRGKITYNTVKGSRWSSGNGEISWNFDVSESGYYKIGLRVIQNFSSNRSSFRTIRVNGKIPFSEMKAYRFSYASGWQGVQLEDERQQPYLIYLEKGSNTISMQVTQAPVKPMISELEKTVTGLMALATDLKALTGGSDDTNRTWKIDNELPGFTDNLGKIADSLDAVQQQLVEVNGRKDAVTQGLFTTIKDIRSMLADPNQIPYKTNSFVTMQGKVAEMLQQLKSQPLGLDRIFIVPENQKFPRMEATFFKKAEGAFVNFFYSFQSKERLSSMDDDVLNVWVLRGRDYINLLQQMADEQFTPATGIKVKINLLPDTNLLVLMNAADIAPDVALGLPQTLPFDYATRNGLYDLTKFPDFDSVYKRFAPGTWIPFYYDKGYYAMPETQSFSMLYYRKDILNELGLEVPNTWEDVYDMLPTLQQNNLNMAPVQHMPFFYQNGAEYFTRNGQQTALGTETGYKSFKEWTDLYNVYAVDQQLASFYQSFRSGTVPIGIADFSMYIQLMVAAPELNGYWGIAPIPGVVQKDGEVARWMGGNLQSSVIFKKTKKAEQSWEFLKWWTSAEVQERYGSDLESINGLSFRWNTSNIEAFVHLPWKREDLNSILEQWRWYKEIPNVPGSYFLERELQNAWNRSVVDGINYRSSLETSIGEIEREMRRKMQEFGNIDSQGHVLRPLVLPEVNMPWEGVNPFVRE
ncbi:extracellular solute-binding protein [Paenibacillus sp. LHD-38]|uniref:extracellular solute-binding protein n=1 Tax=Paenibacillus sp. LHD-38 TaxID=3072143 RepID=UPI00280D3265|nr:extracellular solute-binding protein [Paenibacillus sp. LHD-38]MDQ8737976.1 extracellular solute-binding protein [Paenibacillus sp. LHD-38]